MLPAVLQDNLQCFLPAQPKATLSAARNGSISRERQSLGRVTLYVSSLINTSQGSETDAHHSFEPASFKVPSRSTSSKATSQSLLPIASCPTTTASQENPPNLHLSVPSADCPSYPCPETEDKPSSGFPIMCAADGLPKSSCSNDLFRHRGCGLPSRSGGITGPRTQRRSMYAFVSRPKQKVPLAAPVTSLFWPLTPESAAEVACFCMLGKHLSTRRGRICHVTLAGMCIIAMPHA